MKPRLDREAVLQDIDHVLEFKMRTANSMGAATAFVTRGLSCILRNAPSDSIYGQKAVSAQESESLGSVMLEEIVWGLLTGLRADIDQGKLERFEEMVHGDVFSDFLEQAVYLLNEGPAYRRAAAVLGGGTLEEHLKKLAGKHAISVVTAKGEPKKAAQINSDLYNAKVYGKADLSQIDSWQKIRNEAAHGEPTFEQNYLPERVRMMLDGIRELIARLPA